MHSSLLGLIVRCSSRDGSLASPGTMITPVAPLEKVR